MFTDLKLRSLVCSLIESRYAVCVPWTMGRPPTQPTAVVSSDPDWAIWYCFQWVEWRVRSETGTALYVVDSPLPFNAIRL